MDTEAYLLARREIQGRLAAQRLQMFPEQGANGSRPANFSWWSFVEQLLARDTRWNGLFSGIVTAGVGYALSRVTSRFGLNRFIAMFQPRDRHENS